MHKALYRKWRPKTFDEVCGQEHITSVLKQEAKLGKFSHAYLFCGSRGTGKTTCAKILAKVANCESPADGNPCGVCPSCLAVEQGSTTDVLEMDAASNNGVDNIRDIRDEVMYSPSSLKYRVYIVDEVHMLSNSAFNALLKTLEEPPSHAIFILATTELQKLPATIISRCQRFEFRRIATDALTSRIKYISDMEHINIEEDAARLIARYSQGGMRDAISLLELCASSEKDVTPILVNETIGSVGRELMMNIVSAIADKDLDFLFSEIDSVVRSSKDVIVFWQDLISFYRDILIVKTVNNSAKYLDLTDSEKERLFPIAERFSKESLIYQIKMLEESLYAMQRSGAVKRIIAEMTFVRMCDETLSTSPDALLARISRLEAGITYGSSLSPRADTETAAPEIKKTDKSSPHDEQINKRDAEKSEKQPIKTEAKALKNLKIWTEVILPISELDAGAYAFLKKSRAYRDQNGKIHILVGSFARIVLDNTRIKDALSASLSQRLGESISANDIIYENNDGKDATLDADEGYDKLFDSIEQ